MERGDGEGEGVYKIDDLERFPFGGCHQDSVECGGKSFVILNNNIQILIYGNCRVTPNADAI